MPKKRKYPKRPKQSASLTTWKNYEARCKEVDKHNKKLVTDKKAKASIMQRIRSKY